MKCSESGRGGCNYLISLYNLQGTDQSFLDKLHLVHSANDLYVKPRTEKQEFTVKHYAGDVTYSVKGFIEKNKDTLRSDVVDLLCLSRNQVMGAGEL